MTVGQWIVSISSLATGTALDHITNVVSGVAQIFNIPATSITASISQPEVDADIQSQSVSANILLYSVDSDISQPIYSADITQEKGDL